MMIISAPASAATASTCSSGTSGGHNVILAAMPSSSRSASAAGIWSRAASKIERPRKEARGIDSVEARANSASWIVPPESESERPVVSRENMRSQRLGSDLACIFINPDEIAQGHGMGCVLGVAERIETQLVLQANYHNSKAE